MNRQKIPERRCQKPRCYLIPVGGDSTEFIRVQAMKKPDAKTVKALQDLGRAVGKVAKEPARRKR